MAIGYIIGGGGGGITSSEVTATKENVLAGKTTVTSDSDDAVVNGTMPNIGKVTQTLGINGSYTIPKGFHDGTGKVSQSIVTKSAATYYATTSDQTISSGQYLSGNQVIKKLTASNLSGGNIKPGVTVKVNNGSTDVFSVTGNMPSKAAATYYATTSNQTIAANQYLTGVQTIHKLTQSGFSAANVVKGKTLSVSNGNTNVFYVTGTAQEFSHATGSVTSGSAYQDSTDYTYPLIINLPFIPVTGFVITYYNEDRDITIVDPSNGGGKQSRMVNFNQRKLHGLNSIGYAEGESGYTCTTARVVLPVSYGNRSYNYFFSGYKA